MKLKATCCVNPLAGTTVTELPVTRGHSILMDLRKQSKTAVFTHAANRLIV